MLEWEQYKEDRNGLRYFELSLGSIVKNEKFSARTVAIPDVLQLLDVAIGRLFHIKKLTQMVNHQKTLVGT